AKFSPKLYWLKIVDNKIQLASRPTHTTAKSSEQALKDAFTQLLARPNNFDLVTTIPRQTRLLNLHTTEDGIYVNLSQEFTQGGGSSSMIYRVAQVLYTATSINPQAPVFISIAGQPLNQNYPLGGEGLLLDYPLTRQQFAQEFLAE
ncbi:MAG: GerMN domain-containing protein, partial [Waterburya sp.]